MKNPDSFIGTIGMYQHTNNDYLLSLVNNNITTSYSFVLSGTGSTVIHHTLDYIGHGGTTSFGLNGGYSRVDPALGFTSKDHNSILPPLTINPFPTSKEVVEAIKKDAREKALQELADTLNRQTKRDIEFTAAKDDTERLKLMYQEMQCTNTQLFNIQKLLIDKLI